MILRVIRLTEQLLLIQQRVKDKELREKLVDKASKEEIGRERLGKLATVAQKALLE